MLPPSIKNPDHRPGFLLNILFGLMVMSARTMYMAVVQFFGRGIANFHDSAGKL